MTETIFITPCMMSTSLTIAFPPGFFCLIPVWFEDNFILDKILLLELPLLGKDFFISIFFF